MNIKTVIAVWTGKFITKVLKLFGSGGTSLPGKVALKICPDILGRLAKDIKIICVTGTNGKTTTCHIIRDMIEAKGNTVFCNDAGANLLVGIVSSFVSAATLGGKMKTDYALLECDEAALKSIVEHFGNLDVTAVVTNLFNDQLDRYGDVMITASKIHDGLAQLPNVKLVLNADCSITTSLNDLPCSEIHYFGVNGPLYEGASTDASDARYCVHCNEEYKYEYHTFGHLGGFYCEKCGYKRQAPETALTKVIEWKEASTVIEMNVFGEKFEAEVRLPGGYNLYNALAAVEVAYMIGLSKEQIVSVLGSLTTHFGRLEQVQLGDSSLTLALVKNPAGYNEVLQYIIQQSPNGNIVFGMNDNYADGRDISWLYDVEFERMTEVSKNVKHFYFTGNRARDVEVRLKYAGFDTGKFSVENDFKTLITKLKQDNEQTFLVLSYTCMLGLRDKLSEFVPLKKFEK